ncbi:MAG: hypothetical protein KF760_22495 [Candidatus Eremiobacteraeota bacterium]|nr:hypothetical protein [Candidatus Eremiobacteraeota bacterium]MCW5866403.1 hypothetical protein [Candidatus Eremiobacteraeota bacterium]
MMAHVRYGVLGLLAGGLFCGCGAGGSNNNAGFFNNSNFVAEPAVLARVNRVQLIDPTPNSSDDPALFLIRGFDAQGNLVFGPIERAYDPNLLVGGFPELTADVEVNHERASGFITRTIHHPVDFASDKDGVIELQSHSLLGTAAPRNSFTVKLVNNSAYSDDKVFVSVSGKDRDDTAFYYLKFGTNGAARSLPFGPVSGFADYSAPLTTLAKEEAPHTYSFQCPYENLVSGRIYVSFGKKLQGYGLNNLADKKSLQTPSASGAPDYLTLYEFMELSATIPPVGQGPQEYTLFANTSVVDFFSIGLGMTLSYQNGASETSASVGFVGNARDLILQEFARPSVPDVFKRYIRNQDGSKILRVLGPNQSVALDGENSPIGQFLQTALDSGWLHYAGTVLNVPDNLPSHTFGYQYTGQSIGGPQRLNMTLSAKPAGDTNTPNGELYSLPKPTSRIVFFCDDVLNNRPVNETYANLGSEGHKRLVSLIGAALNRGVFENYTDWGNAAAFYTRPDGKYNWYSKIMHQFAVAGKVYGFGYDDVYGQDPTLARKLDDVNRLVITIPPVEKLTND